MGTILRCTRCNGRMLVEYPYGADHGYGWEATCIACGRVRYPAKPAAKPHAGTRPTTTRRTRNTAPCLPDHDAALRQWLMEHGARDEDIDVNIVAVASDAGCRHEKHLHIALARLTDTGEARASFSRVRAASGVGGWRVRLVREAVV